MIKAEVLNKHLAVEGLRGIKIDNVDNFISLIRAKAGDCQFQVLNANMIAGFEHIYFAVLNALKSFRSRLNISKSLAVETMIFASGQDQIKEAIKILGVKPGLQDIAVMVIADKQDDAISTLSNILDSLGGERDKSVIELTDEKIPAIMSAFNISNSELEASMRGSIKDALKSAIIERMALLVTQR